MTETTRSANGRSEGKSSTPKRARLSIDRVFTSGVHPYEEVTWERRDVVQTNWKTGEVVLSRRALNSPTSGASMPPRSSRPNTSVAHSVPRPVSKSLRQLIDRVVKTTARRGRTSILRRRPVSRVFEHELTWMLLHQYFSFNSPVWFNVGTASPQQVARVSSCQWTTRWTRS